MQLPERMDTLRRMASWLAPGGWLLVEDADFGMWMGNADHIWAAHPPCLARGLSERVLSQGRAIPRQIHRSDLERIGADAELDIVQPVWDQLHGERGEEEAEQEHAGDGC